MLTLKNTNSILKMKGNNSIEIFMSWEVNIISKKSSSNTQDLKILGVFLLPERRKNEEIWLKKECLIKE